MYYVKSRKFFDSSVSAPHQLPIHTSTVSVVALQHLQASLEFKLLFSMNLFALVIDTKFASPETVGDFLICFTEQSVPWSMPLLLWGYACNETCQGLRNKD